MSLHSIRDRAVENYTDLHPGRAIDPASIAVFLELIMQLIAAFQDCRKEPEEAVSMVNSPSRWQKRVMNRRVRREVGRRGWRDHGRDIVVSLLKTGRETSVREMKAAYEDVE